MEDYVRNRITQLRLQNNISEYQMSYDLGHSRSYINNITSGSFHLEPSVKQTIQLEKL